MIPEAFPLQVTCMIHLDLWEGKGSRVKSVRKKFPDQLYFTPRPLLPPSIQTSRSVLKSQNEEIIHKKIEIITWLQFKKIHRINFSHVYILNFYFCGVLLPPCFQGQRFNSHVSLFASNFLMFNNLDCSWLLNRDFYLNMLLIFSDSI